jgi:Putative Actinobacterial Holin-X, holin superfamily III
MLKPANEPMQEPEDERPIGEVVGQLVDEAKAYAKAEVELAKAQALAKAEAYKIPAILLFTAMLFAQAAVTALALTIAFGLSPLIGPVGAGLIAVLFAAGVAAGLAWLAIERLKGAR